MIDTHGKASLLQLACSAPLLLVLGACATPVGHSNRPMETYDRDTEYQMEERPGGFALTIYYSRYQFIPESDAVALACRSSLTAIAYEVAERRGRRIQQVNEQRIRLSMGRNGVTGITSCSATVPVDYADAPAR
jgi:hypothetical protein